VPHASLLAGDVRRETPGHQRPGGAVRAAPGARRQRGSGAETEAPQLNKDLAHERVAGALDGERLPRENPGRTSAAWRGDDPICQIVAPPCSAARGLM
jgi:hypothetical protein